MKRALNATISYGRPAGYRIPNCGELYVASDGHVKQAARPLPSEARLILREFDAEKDFGWRFHMQVSLPVSEVSRILSTTDFTVRRLIKSQRLRAIKVGGQWRVLPDDLQAFMGERANRPPSPNTEEAA